MKEWRNWLHSIQVSEECYLSISSFVILMNWSILGLLDCQPSSWIYLADMLCGRHHVSLDVLGSWDVASLGVASPKVAKAIMHPSAKQQDSILPHSFPPQTCFLSLPWGLHFCPSLECCILRVLLITVCTAHSGCSLQLPVMLAWVAWLCSLHLHLRSAP